MGEPGGEGRVGRAQGPGCGDQILVLAKTRTIFMIDFDVIKVDNFYVIKVASKIECGL